MLQLPVICTSFYVPFVNKDLLSDWAGIVNGQQNTPSVGIDDIMQPHWRKTYSVAQNPHGDTSQPFGWPLMGPGIW